MNIFVLDTDPTLAAQAQCDKHVVKMVLETAQLLCSIYEPGSAPYKRTHYNHPCAVWMRSSLGNWQWLLAHGQALCHEYTHRYGKHHASSHVIAWCSEHAPEFAQVDATPFVQVLPDAYRQEDPVTAYRLYYQKDKAGFARWTRRAPPAWFSVGSSVNI